VISNWKLVNRAEGAPDEKGASVIMGKLFLVFHKKYLFLITVGVAKVKST
jgi:hypothetical protein